ncbi:MAG: hypothetical protein WA678_02755 [Rhabdochlamydiaceae bacterium]|jgi:hypothetical protein
MMSVNATTNNLAWPFPTEDTLQYGSQFLKAADICHAAQVCKVWNTAMQNPDIWLQMFKNEKIPRIEGRTITAKEDFKFMDAITYSARKIACLGRFVGEVPMISANDFNKLQTAIDPYEPGKTMSQTFKVMVEPTHIHRAYDATLSVTLTLTGDFDLNAPENSNLERERLLIPYSLKNLKILAEHPLIKKGEGPVFSHFNSEVLSQCNHTLKTVNVHFMRIEVPEQSRNLTYADQKNRLKEDGYEIIPLITRLYFDVVEILTKDTCPDRKEEQQSTYSRTSDVLHSGNNVYPMAIGGFAPGAGVHVDDDYLVDADDIRGAAPGVPAEVVRPLILRPLALENGT